jgi:site-specific DNA-methyltransferase (adenine-specific)
MKYNPQGVEYKDAQYKRQPTTIFHSKPNRNEGGYKSMVNCPKSILSYGRVRGFHPAEKPVALLEYLIKTYSNEGDTILDNCMGSGSTGVACIRTNRKFIGIELNDEYFAIAEKRVKESQQQLTLF